MSKKNKGFNSQGASKSIFNEEPFDTQFKGFAEAKPVEKAYDPVESSSPTPPSQKDSKGKGGAFWNTVGVLVIILLLVGINHSISEKRAAVGGDDELTTEQLEQLAAVAFQDVDEVSDDDSVEADIVDINLADRSDAGRPSDVDLPPYQQITKVKLAMLANGNGIEGKKRGCDSIYYMDRAIIPTRAPLNSALRELFKKDVQPDFLPGNFLATQTELEFINATIDFGVARVNLTGEVGPYENECDRDRAFIQVEETALQFDTVNSVEIYLDGKKLEVN